jgi:hypothetical protein
MLHRSSGRWNFNIFKTNPTNESASSQQQISDDRAKTIEQQTHDAIQSATASNTSTDSNKKNPK